MSRLLDRELGDRSDAVRPRLPSLFEPGLLSLTPPETDTDDLEADAPASRVSSRPMAAPPPAGEPPGPPPTTGGRPPAPAQAPQPLHQDRAPSDESPTADRPATPPRLPPARTGRPDDEIPQPGSDRSPAPPPAPPLRRREPEPPAAAHPALAFRPAPAPSPATPTSSREREPRADRDPHRATVRRPRPAPVAATPHPAPAAPVVKISIGRVEVRAGAPSEIHPEPRRRPAPRSTPRLSLSDYLQTRRPGGAR